MKAKRIIALILSAVAVVSLVGCVNQHPESAATKTKVNKEVRLVATSPAVAQICSRLNLDLVGVCNTSGTLPEKYDKVKKVGMAMNPDLETIKSLNPDYVLSPSSLKSDLQPKYALTSSKSLWISTRIKIRTRKVRKFLSLWVYRVRISLQPTTAMSVVL